MNFNDKTRLSWSNLQNNFSEFDVNIQDSQAFADVTLVSVNNSHIQANKAILSSASPFVTRLLTNTHDLHPTIHLTGVTKNIP